MNFPLSLKAPAFLSQSPKKKEKRGSVISPLTGYRKSIFSNLKFLLYGSELFYHKKDANLPLIVLPAPKIHFEDAHLIVLSKPAGLLSQGDHTSKPHLVEWLQKYVGRPYIGLVHRLDYFTSGLMVIAKRTKAARRLSEDLQQAKGERFQRKYLAWLIGHTEKEETWIHLLEKDSEIKKMRIKGVPLGKEESKEAGTEKKEFQRAELSMRPIQWLQGEEIQKQSPGGFTLVEFTLQTGRFHQIRAQAAFQGYPLLGDQKYGLFKNKKCFPRPALHSAFLRFYHPMSQVCLTFEETLPEDLKPEQILTRMNVGRVR